MNHARTGTAKAAVTTPIRSRPASRILPVLILEFMSRTVGLGGRVFDRDYSASRQLRHERAAAAAAGAGGAGVTVISHQDLLPFDLVERQGFDAQRFAVPVAKGQIEHLIEIAIVDLSLPADAYEVATHHVVERHRIEVSFQQLYVTIVFAAQFQVRGVAGDRHVSQAKKPVEHDAELFAEYLSIVLFEFVLRRRQVRSNGIVDQIQNQIAGWLAIADVIELLQSAYARLESALAPLPVDIFLGVA